MLDRTCTLSLGATVSDWPFESYL